MNRFFLTALEGAYPANTLTSDFWPAELRQCISAMPPGLWYYFIMVVLAN